MADPSDADGITR